jgi:hypothetical protein
MTGRREQPDACGVWLGAVFGHREVEPRPLSRARSIRFHPANDEVPGEQRDIFPGCAMLGIGRECSRVVRLGRRPAPRRPEADSKVIKGGEQGGGDALPPVPLVHSELVEEHFQALVGVAHLDGGSEPGGYPIHLCDEQVVPRGIHECSGSSCRRWHVEQRRGGKHTVDIGHRTHQNAHTIDRSMLARPRERHRPPCQPHRDRGFLVTELRLIAARSGSRGVDGARAAVDGELNLG